MEGLVLVRFCCIVGNGGDSMRRDIRIRYRMACIYGKKINTRNMFITFT